MNKLAAFVLFLILSIGTQAQISYVDLIPDRILINTTDTLDINFDGVDDLIFTQENNIPGQDANGVGVTLLHYNIEFVGNPPPYDPSHFYTYKLDSNIVVDTNADGKSWVVKLGPNDAVRIMYMYFYNVPYHLGEWINGVVNGYLGIRIKINNHWHYGWIRMDVPVGAQQLTIKDFAYNLLPDQGIYTGQKSSFIHHPICVNYEENQCGNIITYQRDSFSHLAYDKILRLNSNGLYDSIGSVAAASPPYFIHSDSSMLFGEQSYKISAVDSANIQWGMSDSITSFYASISKDMNNNTVLSWTAYDSTKFSQYIIYRTDTLCENRVAIDSVSNNTHSYNINNSLIDSSCNEFQVRLVLNNAINIPGLGIIDTVKTNIATTNTSLQLKPIAGFKSQLVSSGLMDKIQFYDTSKANIKQWYWDFGDGSSSILRHPQHDFLPGKYTISLKVINCFGLDSVSIHDYIEVVNALNINDLDNFLKLYPNPAKQRLIVETAHNHHRIISQIRLLTVDAKEVLLSKNINKTSYTLYLQGLESGLYFVEIQFNNGEKIVKKLIVEAD